MNELTASAAVLVRCQMSEAFDSFVDPDKITRFWLESTSGPLAAGARVEWRFMVPGATELVTVTRFEPDRLIAFDWEGGLHVQLRFEAHAPGTTKVSAEATGFTEMDSAERAAMAIQTTEGFSIVLCDLKTLLDSGRSANLVRDKARLIAESMARQRG